jgi:hypothetical protein
LRFTALSISRTEGGAILGEVTAPVTQKMGQTYFWS